LLLGIFGGQRKKSPKKRAFSKARFFFDISPLPPDLPSPTQISSSKKSEIDGQAD